MKSTEERLGLGTGSEADPDRTVHIEHIVGYRATVPARTLVDVADTFAIIGTQVITILGVLYYLGQRIDGQGRDLREELRVMRGDIRDDMRVTRIDLRADMNEIRDEVRATRSELSSRLDAHVERHAG